MGDTLTAESFAPYVGRVFSISGRDDRLTLASIDLGRGPQIGDRQPFVLYFQSPREKLLPEGFYEFETEGAPRFALYIMPIMTAPGPSQDYQVVFG